MADVGYVCPAEFQVRVVAVCFGGFSQVKVVLPNAECSLLSLDVEFGYGMNCMNLKFSLLCY